MPAVSSKAERKPDALTATQQDAERENRPSLSRLTTKVIYGAGVAVHSWLYLRDLLGNGGLVDHP